jgi:hypothetical protein
MRKELAQVLAAFGRLRLHARDDPGQGAPLAVEKPLDEFVHDYLFTCS